MSSSTTNDPRLSLSTVSSVRTLGKHIVSPIRALSFWIAVALPFLYIPLLAMDLSSRPVIGAFLALLLCNAVTLLIGHSHLQD